MSLIIFSCSPKSANQSNSALIANAFKVGFEAQDNESAIIYYLNKRIEWPNYRKIFANNSEIVFVFPLFWESIPGLLQEFLETLEKKEDYRTKLSFIVQGSFKEACHLRCVERYLEKLPLQLGCIYAGTLIKGRMYTLIESGEKVRNRRLQPFYKMGQIFAKERMFDKDAVTSFAAPERYSPAKTVFIKLIPTDVIAWRMRALKMKTQDSLNAKPYSIN